jgi:uncharacterized phosphosugar-binding protein
MHAASLSASRWASSRHADLKSLSEAADAVLLLLLLLR